MNLINLILKVYLKIYKKVRILTLVTFYKIKYVNQINIDSSIYFRKGFSLILGGKNAKVTIGKNVFFNSYCSVNALGNITIGDSTIFGENVRIYDHNHKYSNPNIPIAEQGYKIDDVNIGSNCWIGSDVVILKGVKIGNHVVIGAGSIIYKDIPDDTVVICKQDCILKGINN